MEEQEQEINLRDYIGVVIKRKKIILGVFFASVIIVGIITLFCLISIKQPFQ